MMITCDLKDKILFQVVEAGMTQDIDIHDAEKDFGIDSITYEAILDQFERFGFIKQMKFLGGGIRLEVSVNAHDFVRRGGFLVQEEILKGNIEKLGWEIDKLSREISPDKLGTIQKITTIGNNILSALNFFNSN
jgi:hypothetical protein